MRIIETKAYKFGELSESAKDKAVLALFDINVSYEWWESTYEDAKNIGLKITGFDIDRRNSIDAEFIWSAEETAHKIVDTHGKTCDTYTTAKAYLKERDGLINTAEKDENGEFVSEYELDSIDAEFLRALKEEYLSMLRKDYDYRTSKEQIIESIEANEYEFTEEGEIV